MTDWVANRLAALERLEAFVPHAGRDYARNRNHDRGPGRHSQVSALSPWIRHRLLLEREVVERTLERHTLCAAEKFVQETCWRTYFKGWLERRPDVWPDYQERLRAELSALDTDTELNSQWQAATTGATDIACFNHWAHELVATGYLHNHARMWFASIWIFTLGLPWTLGADFFLRHLLDGDPASNTLSWRWVAGLQTRGKTYLARPGNIARYTEQRFHPQGELASWAPALDSGIQPQLRASPEGDAWRPQEGDALLLTEDDLHPDFLLNQFDRFQTALAMQATAHRSPLAVPGNVETFAGSALRDGLGRAATSVLSELPTAAVIAPEAIVAQARDAGAARLITPYVPVGPTADALRQLEAQLAAANIPLIRVLRDWDALAWPYATAGFFAFWKRIKPLLSAMGVTAAATSSA